MYISTWNRKAKLNESPSKLLLQIKKILNFHWFSLSTILKVFNLQMRFIKKNWTVIHFNKFEFARKKRSSLKQSKGYPLEKRKCLAKRRTTISNEWLGLLTLVRMLFGFLILLYFCFVLQISLLTLQASRFYL